MQPCTWRYIHAYINVHTHIHKYHTDRHKYIHTYTHTHAASQNSNHVRQSNLRHVCRIDCTGHNRPESEGDTCSGVSFWHFFSFFARSLLHCVGCRYSDPPATCDASIFRQRHNDGRFTMRGTVHAFARVCLFVCVGECGATAQVIFVFVCVFLLYVYECVCACLRVYMYLCVYANMRA